MGIPQRAIATHAALIGKFPISKKLTARKTREIARKSKVRLFLSLKKLSIILFFMPIPHRVYTVKRLLCSYPGKMLYCFCEIGDSFIGVAVFDALFNAMVQMPFQNNLSDLMYGFFDRIYSE
jgi:hypothetical protein